MMEKDADGDLLRELLGDLLGAKVEVKRNVFDRRQQHDVVVEGAGWRLLIEAKVGVGRAALERHRAWSQLPTCSDREVRLLFVPHMPAGLADLCLKWQISWLDEVGNCDIRAPGLRLHVRGVKPDEPRAQRRPGLSSPKSMSFLRYLLFHVGHLVQREAARAAGVDEGQASRIVRQLLDTGAVARKADGSLTVLGKGAILDLIARGDPAGPAGLPFVTVRPTAGTWTSVSDRLRGMAVPHAISGQAAASWLTPSIPAGTCKIWVTAKQDEVSLADMGVEPAEDGDVHLCFTDDDSRLEGRSIVKDVSVAHPGQVFLDCRKEPLSGRDLAELRVLALKDPHNTNMG